MAHAIICDECIQCGACATECPEDAIEEGDDCYLIVPDKCVDCGACAVVCPQECILGPSDAAGGDGDDNGDGGGDGEDSPYN